MRRAAFRARLPIAVAAAMVSVGLTGSPASAACAVPRAPTLKAIWSTTGGPRIVVGVAGGAVPTSLWWQMTSYRTSGWSAWSRAKSKAVRSQRDTVSTTPRLDRNVSQVAYSAYAQNRCGNSGRAQLQVPLATAAKLRFTTPEIASDLPLSLGSIPVEALTPGSAGLPVSVASETAAVCAPNAKRTHITLRTAGDCRIRLSQRTKAISTPNPDLVVELRIEPELRPLPETSTDRPDDVTGFQIHVVYVTVADSPGHDQHGKGLVEMWAQLAQDWLGRHIGKRLILDTYRGSLDVSVLHSAHTTAELALTGAESAGTESGGALGKLKAEYLAASGSTSLRGKNLLFFVDATLSDSYCGWANTPGSLALVTTAPGGRCWSGTSAFLGWGTGLNWPSVTMIHELLHNMGVGHVCVDGTDIMIGDGCPAGRGDGVVTIDVARTQYLGASAAGADILAEKVWTDGSGSRHLPQPNTCYVREPCALVTEYWSSNEQILDLQMLVNGVWQTVATFTAHLATGDHPYPYTYDVVWTAPETGDRTFRYRLEPTAYWLEYLDTPFTVEVPY